MMKDNDYDMVKLMDAILQAEKKKKKDQQKAAAASQKKLGANTKQSPAPKK